MYLPRAAAALLTGVVVPLYWDPEKACSAWQPLITALSTHPTLPFYVIVNPDSGPGSATPDKTYQTCIPSLRAASSNLKVIGYVATGFGDNAESDVEGLVDLYAAWGTAYRPDGIFFDEVSTSTGDLSTYGDYRTYVASKTWHTSGESFVALNPGTNTNSGYFAIADLVMTFEDTYNSFTLSDLTISSAEPAAKQAVILHTAPSSTPTGVIDELVTDGIGAVFITEEADNASTDFNPYTNFPTDWLDFVAAVAAAG